MSINGPHVGKGTDDGSLTQPLLRPDAEVPPGASTATVYGSGDDVMGTARAAEPRATAPPGWGTRHTLVLLMTLCNACLCE